MKNGQNAIGQAIAEIAARVPGQARQNGDYIGDEDLLYCGVCHRPKQCWVDFMGTLRKMPVVCQCEKDRLAAEEAEKARVQFAKKVERLRADCFSKTDGESTSAAEATFSRDKRRDVKVSNAMRRYADQWETMQRQNVGLLLCGNVGTGKSFYAACIANALIDKGIAVKMTSFDRISNTLFGMNTGRQAYLDKLAGYPLLIIDDLGAERSSEYMLGLVFAVIDARYQANLPLIVTTNVDLAEIKEPSDLKYKRIYDRVLEMCHPVKFEGPSYRRETLRENFAERAKLLGLGD